jgi:hypothetical protein
MLLLEGQGMQKFVSEIGTQVIALLAFFAFPIVQYYILKNISKKNGNPELWYLPAYGFRLVISNIPHKKTLTELKCRTRIRKIIPANEGSSVSTLVDETLIDQDEFFLFKGYDHILLNFKLTGSAESELQFVQTDKLGNILRAFSINDFTELISDYTANIKNLFNFDVKVSKRLVLKSDTIKKYWKTIQEDCTEQSFIIDKVISVG